jgi:hypothetical protein
LTAQKLLKFIFLAIAFFLGSQSAQVITQKAFQQSSASFHRRDGGGASETKIGVTKY